MAETVPITRQITTGHGGDKVAPVDVNLEDVEECLVYDRRGTPIRFKELHQDRKAVLIFVRTFLCYSCKEYVDDLSRIPSGILTEADIRLVVIGQSSHHHIEAFCSLTGFPYEIYVDPERHIYRKLGMRRGEEFSGSARPSPHVKSGVMGGLVRSVWRAMTSPVFDFQGDQMQQGGALIAGPGSKVHFGHFDRNRLDHMPISWLLQHAGVQHTLDLSDRSKVIHV